MGKARAKGTIWTVGTILAIVLLSVLALMLGRYQLTFQEIWSAFTRTGEISDMADNVIFNIRLPRVLISLLAGAGLATAGAAFQAVFSNPLAAPDTLGVATGASFGAVLAILFGLPSLLIQSSALVFGLLAVGLVYFVGRTKGGTSPVMLILSGIVISSLFSALVSLVKYSADPQDVLPAITFWLMGSLSSVTRETLYTGAPFLIVGIAVIFLFRWKLNALTLPQEEAQALGIPVSRIRAIVIVGAAMITASAVSMCGLIGWVGLLIPHIARMLFGNNNKYVVPASIGFGAVFLLVIDTAARCVSASEIPVSILTAIIGAPFFILLLRRTGGFRT
ncbi:MAG TPA: iron ABC transporter permease [Candidatus Gallacutalibacter pullicola]|uniref:Iron ABC transporter permease n=1 Tax=Candidatus Gallacutalibacter pullicola TaxID=2840830 RepID=A0A9D1DS65_9FIRM|nr:iron ABC transporter permease [Candidatus Gallacutalibacter pullicola]